MTRRQGDFADRGVHLRTKSGRVIPLRTPELGQMWCLGCYTRGVTVTALSDDGKLLGWCDNPCARADGLPLPPTEPPRRSRRQARVG
jgi:hypothetical protein